MKLRTLVIHNFRCIIHETISLTDYFLVIGSNNAGKSTVVDCLRAFYEKDGFKYKEERDFPYINADGEDSYVDLTFELNDSEYDSLKEEYRLPGNRLAVRKYFKAPSDKTRVNSIYALQADGSHAEEQFYGAKNVQQGKFGNVIYIPATSTVGDVTKLSGPSVMRDLLSDILSSAIQKSDSFKQLTDQFELFSNTAKTATNSTGKSLAGLESEISDLLSPWSTTLKFNIASPSVADILKSLVTYSCYDTNHNKPIQPEQCGTGFQRHFIFSLINLSAKHAEEVQPKKSVEFKPSLTLLLFEEPEAFLHPPQQGTLAASLQELASKGDHQVICSTHSSIFMSKSMENIPSISRVKRIGGLTTIHQISSERLAEIVGDNIKINDIVKKHEPKHVYDDDYMFIMDEIKYAFWMNSERCAAFFASHVVLVEGASEKALIERLISDGKISCGGMQVHFLDCIGKYNVHRFMHLATSLGLRHSVIIDEDGTPKHNEINQLIDDSKDGTYCEKIIILPKDLETFLGIPKSKRSDRKPQHALLHYSEGRIEQAKLDQFCRIVESTFAEQGAAAAV